MINLHMLPSIRDKLTYAPHWGVPSMHDDKLTYAPSIREKNLHMLPSIRDKLT